MTIDFESSRHQLWLILIAIGFALVYNIWSWGVIESSEARYAEMAWEMMRSGNFLHPSFLNIDHYHKPPMTYWITVASFKIFGTTPFAARILVQLAVLDTMFAGLQNQRAVME